MNMFIKEDPASRLTLAGLLGAANLAIVGALAFFAWGEEGLFWMLLAAPLLGYIALSTALMLIPEAE
jgi:hypothetical protein